MVKADLMKVFDSTDWDSVLTILISIGVPTMFLEWIKDCISIPPFSINILEGYFPGETVEGKEIPYFHISLCL